MCFPLFFCLLRRPQFDPCTEAIQTSRSTIRPPCTLRRRHFGQGVGILGHDGSESIVMIQRLQFDLCTEANTPRDQSGYATSATYPEKDLPGVPDLFQFRCTFRNLE